VSRLRQRSAWIFDLDGTLTRAQHDFAAIRRELGIAERASILEALEQMPEPERTLKKRRLDDMEEEIAAEARVADGAHALLEHLRGRGHQLGVLTRNSKSNAHIALAATGLDAFFAPELVLGRGEARPKPDPGGILHLLGAWGCGPTEAVMLGDYVYDLDAGRNAGCMTIHVDALDRFDFGERADLRTLGLAPLHKLLAQPKSEPG
jgi:HAD superfamily hydrolase (TIGR01509 family)